MLHWQRRIAYGGDDWGVVPLLHGLPHEVAGAREGQNHQEEPQQPVQCVGALNNVPEWKKLCPFFE